MRIPARLTFEEAASIPEAFMTAYDAVFFGQLGLQIGQRLLVHPAGSGVGTAAVQTAAKRAGLRTVGTSRSLSKLEKAAELGLEKLNPRLC